MSAATVTGPAHEPRPTSSIPHTTSSPALQHLRSSRNVGKGPIQLPPPRITSPTPPRIARTLPGGCIAAGEGYDPRVRPGTRVEVRSRFEDRWTRGFEVSEVLERSDGSPEYRVRRRSDNSILPVTFTDDDLREERRRQSM